MSAALTRHVKLLLDSYKKFVGEELIDRETAELDALAISNASFVVVSHGTQEDPVLNYGNKKALKLWEMQWDEFTKTPSRYTAEPVNREMRAKMLQEANDKGCFEAYEGVRISSSGKRFMIKNVMIWNLVDESDNPYGQAATFKEIEYL